MYRKQRPTVKPLRLSIPDEFDPSRKITAKQFTFAQSGSRKQMTDEKPEQNPEEEEKHNEEDQQKHTEEEEKPRKRQAEKSQTILDDPECVQMREQTIDNHDFTDLSREDMELLLQHTKEYIRYVASKADYEEARRAKALYDAATNALYHKINDREKSNQPREELQEKRRTQEGAWQKELDDYDTETNAKLQQLEEKHQNELRDYDQKWQEDDTFRKYRKPSARLLDLWRKEKFMARTGQFNEAEIIKAEAEELQQREMNMAQAMLNRDYHLDRDKIVTRQQQEIESLIQTRDHWKSVIVSRQKNEKDVYGNKEIVVEARHKEPFRKREAQLPQKKAPKQRSSAGSATSTGRSRSKKKLISTGAGISFQYQTVLPPLAPPSGNPAPSRSVSRASNDSAKTTGSVKKSVEEEEKNESVNL